MANTENVTTLPTPTDTADITPATVHASALLAVCQLADSVDDPGLLIAQAAALYPAPQKRTTNPAGAPKRRNANK